MQWVSSQEVRLKQCNAEQKKIQDEDSLERLVGKVGRKGMSKIEGKTMSIEGITGRLLAWHGTR